MSAAGHEAVSDDGVAQIHIDEKARQLFLWADTEDRAARFGKYGEFQTLQADVFMLTMNYDILRYSE